MSRAKDFIRRVNRYGTTATVYMKPSTDNKCDCWEYNYPDPDCPKCEGDGYLEKARVHTVKAFIFPLRDSNKDIDFINIGHALGGQIMAYFSPDFDLDSAEYVIWNGVKYLVTSVDCAMIEDEMIYRSCHLDRVD